MTPTPQPIALQNVERELNLQMKRLQGQGSQPMQRARMSNLVIFCNSPARATELAPQISAITEVHPARTLMLIGETEPEQALTTTVEVRPLGASRKQHICVEQVTLHAGGSSVPSLPFAVRSLVIGDLPVNFWWDVPQPPPQGGNLLFDLAENAQQVIYDSVGWPDPAHGVAMTAAWLEQIERTGSQWRVASDLNWRRLKFWRRFVMQALDPVVAPGAAQSVTELLVEHGPHASVQGWLLATWLARRLGWTLKGGKVTPGHEMLWRFDGPTDDVSIRVRRLDAGPAEVRHVRIACKLEGKPVALNLTAEDGQRLAGTTEGLDVSPRTMSIPPTAPEELVGKQLSDRERDKSFHACMAIARTMAESLF
jgi:glucose-6-phosphate dehydrogenase assembly protein OpcA